MQRSHRFIFGVMIVAVIIAVLFGLFASQAESMPTIEEVVEGMLVDRQASLAETSSDVPFGSESEVNVLLMGLDARVGEENPHCDALHMFTLNVEDWTVTVTTVPRGTYAYIPGVTDPTQLYIANACYYEGLEYGIEKIEEVAGVKADYVVTVGFSQAMGVFRVFDLPAAETLQWLRHRHSYAIGEPQRARNQSEFIKDMIATQLDRFTSDLMIPIEYVLYQLIDTDMPFDVGHTLLRAVAESGLDERPDDITLVMKPHYETAEIHFDVENAEEQIAELYAYIETLLTEDDFSGISTDDLQTQLTDMLEIALALDDFDDQLFEQQLWLQVEDDEKREEIHYRFIEDYAEAYVDDDPDAVIELISDYILEKQTLGLSEWEERGKELLASALDK